MASQIFFSACALRIVAEAIAVSTDSGCKAAHIASVFVSSSKYREQNYVQFCSLFLFVFSNSHFRTGNKIANIKLHQSMDMLFHEVDA